MKTSTILFLFLTVTYAAHGLPNSDSHALVLRQRRQLDTFGNIRVLIEQLIENLRTAANKALESIATFNNGIQEQITLFRQKLVQDLEQLRKRVTEAFQSLADRVTNTGAAVRDCFETRRTAADNLFNATLSKTMSCAEDRVKDINDQIENLTDIANGAVEFSNNALSEMKNCADKNGNIFATGSCLGTVAIQTELKGTRFLAQSGISIARINLALATLPASLEVCAGTSLVEAGIETAKIVMDVGGCSASSVMSSVVGKSSLT